MANGSAGNGHPPGWREVDRLDARINKAHGRIGGVEKQVRRCEVLLLLLLGLSIATNDVIRSVVTGIFRIGP